MEKVLCIYYSYGNYSFRDGESHYPGEWPAKPQYVPQMDSAIMPRSNESASASIVCDVTKTTCFVEDESKVEVALVGGKKIDKTEVRMVTIYDFLGKPLLLTQGTWATSSTAGTNLYTIPIGSYLTTSTGNYFPHKIEGFSLMRATAVIRVTINANPFQQGMLFMHLLPCYADINFQDSSYGLMHNVNLTTKYQQPKVEMTCRDSVMELRVPYVSPTSWYDIKVGSYDWGTVWLDVFSPLLVGANATSTSVDYAVYLHFEDVELAGPVVPQSDSGRTRVRGRVSKEEAKMEKGPVSSALSSVADAAASLASIPILSFLGSVPWALRAASGVASIFGWSKPDSEASASPMSLQTFRYGATSDGMDLSYPLALIQDNEIEMSDKFTITREDEMSFEFLKQVPHFFASINWATSQVSGTALLTQQVAPFLLGVQTTGPTYGGHAVTYLTGAPWVTMSGDFSFWRGSITVTIKIIKTDYHSGKLDISWTPGQVHATLPTLATGVLALREIVDIRQQSEIVLNLPYMHYRPYLATDIASGALRIQVLNELRAPESAPVSVNLLIFFSAGSDFEYAAPNKNGLVGAVYVPQADNEVIVKSGIAQSATPSRGVEIAKNCIGEVFLSVKQFLNRYGELYQSGVFLNAGNNIQIWPWFISIISQNTTSGAIVVPQLGGDPFGDFAPMYAFFRGTARVLVAPAGTAGVIRASVQPVLSDFIDILAAGNSLRGTTTTQSAWYTHSSYYTGPSGITITDDAGKSLPVRVPFYCATPVATAITTFPGNFMPYGYNETPQSVALFTSTATSFSTYSIFRSFADDFQLTYFVGAPPRFLSTT